ncbi:hypothetical protein LZ086_18435 [Acinetobacter johnsonii]|nr:hypothetical protein LZ086_18435 [Acinetobacter johnsonii]
MFTALFLLGLCGLLFLPVRYSEVTVAQMQCRISTAQFSLQWKHSVEKLVGLKTINESNSTLYCATPT